VYVFNDIVDVDKDRAHPLKRLRPIASGALLGEESHGRSRRFWLGRLGGSYLITPSWRPSPPAIWCRTSPILLAEARAVVDVGVQSARAFSCVCWEAPVPSRWILGAGCCWCTLLLAAFLGFGQTRP